MANRVKVSVKFAWYDIWIGAYVDTNAVDWTIYVCLIPCFPIKIQIEDSEYYEELDYPTGRPPREENNNG